MCIFCCTRRRHTCFGYPEFTKAGKCPYPQQCIYLYARKPHSFQIYFHFHLRAFNPIGIIIAHQRFEAAKPDSVPAYRLYQAKSCSYNAQSAELFCIIKHFQKASSRHGTVKSYSCYTAFLHSVYRSILLIGNHYRLCKIAVKPCALIPFPCSDTHVIRFIAVCTDCITGCAGTRNKRAVYILLKILIC